MRPDSAHSTVWPLTPGSLPAPAMRPATGIRLSLVMPSYNHGTFIEAAIRSVLLQAHPAVELIVVDAGSTDATPTVLARYAPWIPRTVVEPDRGPADALNKGFALAHGDLLGFLNADDFLLPGSLDTVIRWFDAHAEADVVSGHGYMAAPSGELGPPLVSDAWDRAQFVRGTCILVQAATFFRRAAFTRAGGFPVSAHKAWDMELWAGMAETGAAFATLDASLAAHRMHAESITGNPAFRAARLADARLVRERLLGRHEALGDRLSVAWHRLRKFSQHPRRTLAQRAFCHATLGRWSL